MYLQEILQLDAEISDDLKTVESRLLRLFPPRKLAGNCLVVSVNMAELVQLAIQVEFDQYADCEIFLEIGTVGKPRIAGGEVKWLWEAQDILPLCSNLTSLANTREQGYHAWLTFAGAVIDPTVLFTLTHEEEDASQARPFYIDRNGLTHPPGWEIHYRSVKRFSVADLQQYPRLFLE